MTSIGPNGISRCAVPDLYGLTAVGYSHVLAIRRPSNAIHPPITAVYPANSTHNGIPDLYRLIKAHGSDTLAIGRPFNSRYSVKVTIVGQQGTPCTCIPESHRGINLATTLWLKPSRHVAFRRSRNIRATPYGGSLNGSTRKQFFTVRTKTTIIGYVD